MITFSPLLPPTPLPSVAMPIPTAFSCQTVGQVPFDWLLITPVAVLADASDEVEPAPLTAEPEPEHRDEILQSILLLGPQPPFEFRSALPPKSGDSARATILEKADRAAPLVMDGFQAPPAPTLCPVSESAEILPTDALPILSATDRCLDFAREDLWLNQLARDIVTAGTDDHMAFRLLPPKLGQLDVDVSRQATGLSIRFVAEHHEARAILIAAQSELVADIQSQGVRVIEAQVASGHPQQQERQATPAPRPPIISFEHRHSAVPSTPPRRRTRGRFA